MAKKTPGIILYPEDMERIRKMVKPQYQFAVVYALTRYADSGEMPTEEELGEGGMVAFGFIVDKVTSALNAFKEKSKRNSENATSGWEKRNDATACDGMESDATVCETMRTDATACNTEYRIQNTEYKNRIQNAEAEGLKRARAKRNASPAPADEPVLAFTGEDMREDIKRNELADQLIVRYNIQRNEPTREALLEDLEKHGEERMLEVLNTAAFANSRDKLTAQFWRSILANVGKPKPSKGSPPKDYTTRQYTANDYKGMEVDLDAD